MNSFQSIVESYSNLESALRQILQGQTPELAVVQEGDYPLLVLETSFDSVGFAVLNGNSEDAYIAA